MRKPVIAAWIACVTLAVGAAVVGFGSTVTHARDMAGRSKSADRIHTLLLLHVDEASPGRPLPPLHGKRFILWLVASRKLDARSPKNLEILFSPADETRSLEEAGGAAAYEKVRLEALMTGSLDVRALTSFAGPGRFDPGLDISSARDPASGRPLIADVSFEDGANIGFLNGTVRWFTRAELGVPPGVPITVGPSSPSPLLRGLSDD